MEPKDSPTFESIIILLMQKTILLLGRMQTILVAESQGGKCAEGLNGSTCSRNVLLSQYSFIVLRFRYCLLRK